MNRDYGSSDFDIVANNENWFPDLLDSNKTPLFYKVFTISPPKSKVDPRKEEDQIQSKKSLKNLTVNELFQRIAFDILNLITDLLTFQWSADMFTSGTRSFSLGIFVLVFSLFLFIFSSQETKSNLVRPIKIYFSS